MRKLLTLFVTVIMYTSLVSFSASAQEYQDFIANWYDFFPLSANPANTGLTLFPVLEISPGGERGNLGNAYTAVARDISFFESNAAASAILQRTELAFFHRNLISDVSMDSVMYARHFNNLGYGFAAKFLHFEFTSVNGQGRQLASANPSETMFAGNIAYNFFPNFYFTGIAAGMNLKIVYRNVPSELYQQVLDPSAYNQNLFGYMTDFGLLSRFNLLKGYAARDKNFSVGLSLKNLGLPVNGEPLPTEASAGIAYRPLRFLMISGDLNLPMNLVDFSKFEGLGFATGLDVRFVDFFSLQSGFQWRGYNPRFSLGANINLKPVAFQINYTLDLTTASNALDNFSVTAKLDFGDEGRAVLQEKVDELYIEALIALSNGEFQKVIDLCYQIVDPEAGIDPSFTPAKQTLKVAQTTLDREAEFVEFERNQQADSTASGNTGSDSATDSPSADENTQ